MPFRIGLIFDWFPEQAFVSASLAELLKKIEMKTMQVRKDQPITLVPFIRTKDMAHFTKAIADNGAYAVEAVTFDESGVNSSSLEALTQTEHSEFVSDVDFDLGMKVLLARCAVVIIMTKETLEFPTFGNRLASLRNTSSCLALVQGNENSFWEVDPEPEQKDGPSWLLAVLERWAVLNVTPPALPRPKRTRLGLIFPIFYTAIIRRRSETLKKQKPTETEQCEAGMGLSNTAKKKLTEADNNSLKLTLDTICQHFVRHDSLGRHYSNAFRTTCLMVPLLVVASTLLAVLAAIDKDRHEVWHVFEGLLLVAAAVLFLSSKFADYHRKWVEHRLLTELLRPTLLSTLFQMLPQLTPPGEETKLWIERTRILLGHLRSLTMTSYNSPKEDLRSARVSALNDFANYQARWHKDFADQHRTAEKRLTRLSAYSFIVTLCLCALQLVFAFSVRVVDIRPEVMTAYQEVMTSVGHVLLMLTLFSGGVAFVLLILLHQLGFEAIAERSTNASEYFEALRAEITQKGYHTDARLLYAWADKCWAAILAEQHSWYRQIPLIRMHL